MKVVRDVDPQKLQFVAHCRRHTPTLQQRGTRIPDSYFRLLELRHSLVRTRLLADLFRKREELKYNMAQCQFMMFRKQRAMHDKNFKDAPRVDDYEFRNGKIEKPKRKKNSRNITVYKWGNNNYRVSIPLSLLPSRKRKRTKPMLSAEPPKKKKKVQKVKAVKHERKKTKRFERPPIPERNKEPRCIVVHPDFGRCEYKTGQAKDHYRKYCSLHSKLANRTPYYGGNAKEDKLMPKWKNLDNKLVGDSPNQVSRPGVA